MKLPKQLVVEQTLPDWRDNKFLSYDDLKKRLELVCPKDNLNSPQLDAHVTEEANQFLHLLWVEIDKLNAVFAGKEEEYIIIWEELQDRVSRATDSAVELMSIGREIVDFHGEMVLFQNYNALNYTGKYVLKSISINETVGLVKIIKEYDKRTGALHRSPYIQKVLNQPFFKTDMLKNLVKECEVILSILFTNDGSLGPTFSTNMGVALRLEMKIESPRRRFPEIFA